MATLDDLYTQLSQTKKTLSALQVTLQQQTTAWNTALSQLKLPGSRPLPVSRPLVASKTVVSKPLTPTTPAAPTPPAPTPPAPTPSAPVYAVTDLPALATAVMQAQTASTAAKAAMDAINAEIQTAIAAKG